MPGEQHECHLRRRSSACALARPGKPEYEGTWPSYSIAIDPSPDGALDCVLSHYVGMPFADWCLTFAPREVWLSTSREAAFTDEDFVRVGVLHAAAAGYEFVKMRTMLGLVPVYDRRYDACLSPDGVSVS